MAKEQQSTAPKFGALLDRQIGTSERPKPVPPGTWEVLVTSHKFGESAQKKTPYVEFTFRLQSPKDDVDPDALDGFDFRGKTVRDTFYLTEDAMFRLEEFLKACGMEGTVRENIQASANRAVLAAVVNAVGQAKTPGGEPPIYTNISGYAPVD